jgi:hypothetical protein
MLSKKTIAFLFLLIGCKLSAQTSVSNDFFTAYYFSDGKPGWTHTTGTGSNRILLVFITNAGKNTSTNASDVASVTYNGTAMTVLAKAESRPRLKSYLYYLLNPASGTNSIAVNLTNPSDYCAVGSASFSNVTQAAPYFETFGDNITAAVSTISTPYVNDLLLGFCGTANNVTGVGVGQTQLFEAGSASKSYVNLSSKTSSSSSTTFSITIASTTADWELVNVRLTPTNAQVLPVELSKYQLKCFDGKIMLDWTTDSELNNDYFTIERSRDCRFFEPIAKIAGSGTTNELVEYFYVDEDAIEGITYYRLKQTDYNGNSKTYAPLSARCEKESPEILMYPNPNHGIFSVHFPDYNNDVIILNSAGQTIYKQFVSSNQTQFNIEEVPAGIYHLMSHSVSGNNSINFRKD